MENVRQEGDVAVYFHLLPNKYTYVFTCIDMKLSFNSNNLRYFKICICANQALYYNMINFYLSFCLLFALSLF